MSDWRADSAWPSVDVVMPILNEAAHLPAALAAVRAQNYPGAVQVIMAIGPSQDGTTEVASTLAAADDALVVIDNPTGRTPAALNLAIRAGSSPVVVRVDGHSQLSPRYIEQAVGTLRRTGAANVGGMQSPIATTTFETAVAAATTSWLGTGGATYRTGGTEGPVDTVYLGVFDRAAIEHVGLYDESLIRNQDYELNIRLRQAGYMVIFDPALSVRYTPRGSLRALARQYWEYGWWKAVVIRRHPRATRVRQLVPPIGIAVVAIGAMAGIRWRSALAFPLAYLSAVLYTAARTTERLRVAGALATMHFAWVAGLASGAFVHSARVRSQMTGGRPRRHNRQTVAYRIGRRSTDNRQPSNQPRT